MGGHPTGNLIGTQRKPSGQGRAAGVNLPLGFPLGLKIGFWFSIAIAIAVVLRRVVALSTPPSPNAPPQLAGLDAYFNAHANLTYVHILCALAFVLLLPLLFWHRTRDSIVLGRVIFPLGLIVGLTAYAMSSHAVGGWLERAAVLFFNTLFLFALYRAWSYTRQQRPPAAAALDAPRHRHPARHRHHASRHGRLLRHVATHPPHARTVLRHRFLDRLFAQHRPHRTLAPHSRAHRIRIIAKRAARGKA